MKYPVLTIFIVVFFISSIIVISTVNNKNESENLNNNEEVIEIIEEVPVSVEEPLKIDSLKIKELKPFFYHKSDEFSENNLVWITEKSAAKYRNQNGIYCYFSQNNLRFVYQYHKSDWLFIDKLIFLIDGKTFQFIPEEMKRDNDSSGITEWFDVAVDYNNRDILKALSNAKSAKIKLIGDKYADVKIISKKELLSIKRTLEYYQALGNNL